MPWAVSTCEPCMTLHVVQLNPLCLVGSTLLHLTTNGTFFGAVSPTGGRYGSVTIDTSLRFILLCCILVLIAPLVALLHLAFHCSLEYDPFLCHSERYDPHQLSGGYRVCSTLLLTRALTWCNFKLWMVFAIVSTPSYALPS
jgi:hypothetical protein